MLHQVYKNTKDPDPIFQKFTSSIINLMDIVTSYHTDDVVDYQALDGLKE